MKKMKWTNNVKTKTKNKKQKNAKNQNLKNYMKIEKWHEKNMKTKKEDGQDDENNINYD